MIGGSHSIWGCFATPKPRTYSIVEFGFYIQRKTSYYTVSIILPVLASSIIELTTFALANNDVNRIKFSFICFISLTFYVSMLTDKLPQNSESMPFLLIALCATTASLCLVIVLQTLTYYLVTSTRGLVLKIPQPHRNRLADCLNCFAMSFYLTTVLVSQVFIPWYKLQFL